MKNYFVYPYRYECDNAIMLKNYLGGKRIKLEESTYKHDPERNIVVNWGNSNCPFSGKSVVNQPFNVSLAVNKSVSFDIFRNNNIRTPELTRYKPLALQWVKEGHSVVGRSLLKGNNGKGIFFLENEPDRDAKLFTKYVHDCQEFRVNIYRDKLISIRKKVKNPVAPVNKIRSGLNGYFFKDVALSLELQLILEDIAEKSIRVLGLDFGGVDVLVNCLGQAYVLEVNTAPELQGKAIQTLGDYIKQDYK